MCAHEWWSLKRPEEGVRSSEAGDRGPCELPSVSAESQMNPFQEHQVILTTEPSFHILPEKLLHDPGYIKWVCGAIEVAADKNAV